VDSWSQDLQISHLVNVPNVLVSAVLSLDIFGAGSFLIESSYRGAS
jgi:acetamidase/formamidase